MTTSQPALDPPEPTGLDIAYDDRVGVGVRLEDWTSRNGEYRFIGLVFVTRTDEDAYDLTPHQATALRDALIAMT